MTYIVFVIGNFCFEVRTTVLAIVVLDVILGFFLVQTVVSLAWCWLLRLILSIFLPRLGWRSVGRSDPPLQKQTSYL